MGCPHDRDPDNWGYRNIGELKARVQKLRREIGAAPTGSISITGNNDSCINQVLALRRLFARARIAIVFVLTVSGQPDLTTLGIYLPKSNERPVTKYYLWSSEATNSDRSGIGYSDALAKKVGNEFKLLLDREEFMEIYDKVQPVKDVTGVWRRKELFQGKEMPRAVRMQW